MDFPHMDLLNTIKHHVKYVTMEASDSYDISIRARVETDAFLLAEQDGFRQDPQIYWGDAVDWVSLRFLSELRQRADVYRDVEVPLWHDKEFIEPEYLQEIRSGDTGDALYWGENQFRWKYSTWKLEPSLYDKDHALKLLSKIQKSRAS